MEEDKEIIEAFKVSSPKMRVSEEDEEANELRKQIGHGGFRLTKRNLLLLEKSSKQFAVEESQKMRLEEGEEKPMYLDPTWILKNRVEVTETKSVISSKISNGKKKINQYVVLKELGR